MRFIDGLREDLRAPILIQRPTSLDTAFVLAQLQEEVSSSTRRKEFRKQDFSFKTATPWALPPPPARSDKPNNLSAEDRRATEAARAKLSTEDRLPALRATRRAQGLCQHCAEKWTRGHKCAGKIQLHALQELLEIFQCTEVTDEAEGVI
jgi:hypothetical protein